MRELPRGTVTFLFTDIEGSTRLLHELGDGYAEALADHRRLVREAFAAHGGVEVDTQGDAFFVAFSRASDAVAAAAEAQRALGSGPVRVRMGLHTGEPIATGEGYVGMDVHKGARIAAAGHGGQVLLSEATARLVDVAGLRDLGEHRLKDLTAPIRLYQLGGGDFPRLKTLYGTNLPIQPTPLVGRERELREAGALLRSHRLLTLTGPGGSGKTRLALQLAAETSEDFPHGVFFVPLQALRDPELVEPAIAHTLGAQDGLADQIADKRLLLVLDNFEQLVEGASALGELLAKTSRARLLVTSREPLHLAAEHRYTVEPLNEEDAVTLFVERARAVEPAFQATHAVAAICRRLDGLPLAIELAAARVNVLDPDTLLARLERSLPLLTGGARDVPERQRTLRATIEWSYELLTGDEQQLFRRLAVFAGSFDLECAEAVAWADLDTLQSLVDKSLVRRFGSGRFGMLETIHEYALELLERDADTAEIRLRHAEHFAAFAEEADSHSRLGADQRGSVDRMERDYANIRQGVLWSLGAAPEIALRIVGNVAFFTWVRGGFAEVRSWLDQALSLELDHDPRLRAKALEGGAVIADRQGDVAAQTRFAEECHALYSALGDDHGLASALRERAKAATAAGDLERAKALYAECAAVAERSGDEWNRAVATNNLGDLALREEEWERAVELCGASREVRLRLGDRWGGALTLMNVALAELHLDRLSAARRDFRQALVESVESGATTLVARGLEELAASIRPELPREATRIRGAAAAIRAELGLVPDPIERRFDEQAEAALRSELPPEIWQRELELGREMTVDEAVQFALAVSA